jgi:hypothetical protein
VLRRLSHPESAGVKAMGASERPCEFKEEPGLLPRLLPLLPLLLLLPPLLLPLPLPLPLLDEDPDVVPFSPPVAPPLLTLNESELKGTPSYEEWEMKYRTARN